MMASLELSDIAALSPLLSVLLGSLAVLLIESFAPANLAKRLTSFTAILTLIIATLATVLSFKSSHPLLVRWLSFDALGQFFTLLFSSIGIACSLLGLTFFKKFNATHGEYYFLLLSSVFGLMMIGYSADFLTLFLGVEILSLSLYVLCGYMKEWKISQESSLKYFLMGTIAAAFLLYGIALIYGATGTTRFDSLLEKYQALTHPSERALFLSGIGLVTLGLAFEAAIFPFQVWTPDVYEGASTPVTALMASGTKAGAFAAFVRVFMEALPQFNLVWSRAMSFMTIATLVYANFVAIRQKQLRRFFAYSGISHAGFMLIPLIAGTADALNALQFYLIVYLIATLGSFAILGIFDKQNEGLTMNDFRGLFWQNPLHCSILILCLLTLGGIPPTIGFFAKFYLFKVAFESGYYELIIVGSLTTVLSMYYYLKIVAIMLAKGEIKREEERISFSPALVVAIFSCIAILFISFFPTGLFIQ